MHVDGRTQRTLRGAGLDAEAVTAAVGRVAAAVGRITAATDRVAAAPGRIAERPLGATIHDRVRFADDGDER